MVTRKEVVEKVTALVRRKFGGDWKKAFDHYDENGDGLASTDEIASMLALAGVGYRLTRWAIAEHIITLMDSDNDGQVSFDEFKAHLT